MFPSRIPRGGRKWWHTSMFMPSTLSQVEADLMCKLARYLICQAARSHLKEKTFLSKHGESSLNGYRSLLKTILLPSLKLKKQYEKLFGLTNHYFSNYIPYFLFFVFRYYLLVFLNVRFIYFLVLVLCEVIEMEKELLYVQKMPKQIVSMIVDKESITEHRTD